MGGHHSRRRRDLRDIQSSLVAEVRCWFSLAHLPTMLVARYPRVTAWAPLPSMCGLKTKTPFFFFSPKGIGPQLRRFLRAPRATLRSTPSGASLWVGALVEEGGTEWSKGERSCNCVKVASMST